ncbi:CatB-related O-acetyltransferase [Caviibacterium pharyngocola]|uniref:Transferase n=1 Tax=Caviibacterium pharyngocola TaxID=28159 RepID=A0A2M8RX85_9PAST|nr:CatB-related O-acetyltransferase [Caviibacterium pharyngocola]PJG83509.1 transferase [Caviibacterium pharyngocola]
MNLFKIPILGKFFLHYLSNKQGGEKTSVILRKFIKSEYNVDIELYTYGGCFSNKFNIGGTVKIGRYCSIGPDVCYLGANHPMERAVMSAYFYNKNFSGFDVRDVERKELIIGNDVWIGRNATILSSCSVIGNGAVIGAGAVVTKDVPPYAIVIGIPAKILRYRFNQGIIDNLEKSQWWKFTPEELMEFYSDIDEPELWSQKLLQLAEKKLTK